MVSEHRLSRSKACQIVGFSRSALYKPTVDWAAKDAPVIAALNEIVSKRSRWGFWKCPQRFNKSFRVEMQKAADEWLMERNEYRPHESLGDFPPAPFLPRAFE